MVKSDQQAALKEIYEKGHKTEGVGNPLAQDHGQVACFSIE